jgi:hypothetical protein
MRLLSRSTRADPRAASVAVTNELGVRMRSSWARACDTVFRGNAVAAPGVLDDPLVVDSSSPVGVGIPAGGDGHARTGTAAARR